MRYLLVGDKGLYLKRVEETVDLLFPSDLKSLALEDVQDPHKVEICTLKGGDRAFVIKVTKIPQGCILVRYDTKISWAAYHTIVCYELKLQLAQIAEQVTDKQFIYKVISFLERIFLRGRNPYGNKTT